MTTSATTPPAAPAAPAGRAGSPTRPPQSRGRRPLTDEERKQRFEARLAATRNEHSTRLALAIAKRLTDDGAVLCPKCGKGAPRGKFKIHADGGWKHFSSTGCSGDAVAVLQAAGISTGDAVRVLNGLPTRTPIEVPEDAAALAQAFVGVKSVVDTNVFNAVLHYGRNTGGVELAKEFYGTWHISPEAVQESGAVVIADPKQFEQGLIAKFGVERLIACGLFTTNSKGEPFCLVSKRFPVVEPHRHPVTGDVLYMQFRASHEQYERYLAHKRGEREYKGSEKIISLRGAPTEAQIGTGLHVLGARNPDGTYVVPDEAEVTIVEGFKDTLAGRTAGLHTYGLPGTGVRPPAEVCKLLSRFTTVKVAMDGDEAGNNARDELVEYLREHQVRAEPMAMPKDLDLTDVLVGWHASGHWTGTPCGCPTCTKFRTDHPDRFRNS
jgi:hypothetical protein